MSAFDTQITLGGTGVSLQTETDDGPAYVAELGLLVVLPVAPGQALPLGYLRAQMNVDAVDDLITKLTEARAGMSEKPDITIANSLAGVDKIASQQQGLRG